MELTETSNTLDQLASAWEEFKIVNDRRLQNLERKGNASALDTEHINRLNKVLDECNTRINTIENSSFRPASGGESLEKQNFFRDYLRKGTHNQLLEKKNIGEDSGIPLTQTIYDEIMLNLKSNSTMRQIASVDTISSDYITFFKPNRDIAATWGDTITNENLPSVSQKKIQTHTLHSCPTITRKLLDDAAIDIDKWINNNLTEAFATAENRSFFRGNGINQPLGLLEVSTIQTIGSNTPSLSAGDIIKLYYSLGEEYAAKASFVMHRSTAHLIRSLKSEQNDQYIWQPGLQNNSDTLLGVPIYHSPEMYEIPTNNVVIAFGDFTKAYKIIDRADINILRDQFSNKPNIIFYASKRVGGSVVDERAMVFLKIAN